MIVAQPVCSIAEADRRLCEEPRFTRETAVVDGVAVRRWTQGPTTLTDMAALYRQYDAREFLVLGQERCTYGAARRAAQQLAHALLKAGLEPGDRVALLMRNRLEWPVCFFGAALAGAIVVPINGWGLAQEAQDTIADCGARFAFADRADVAMPAGVAHLWSLAAGSAARLHEVIGTSASWEALPDASPPSPPRGPDDTAAIFYTSGTTSRPKGVPISHRAITATVKNSEYGAARAALRFPGSAAAPPAQPIALFPVPFFHVTGTIPGLIATSAMGARIVLMQRWDVEQALALIEREKVTLLGGVPTMPLQVLKHPRLADYDLSSLTGLAYGGAPAPSGLPAAIADRLSAAASTGWGMTETASTLLYNGGPDFLLRPASCGAPVPVNAARIADRQDQEVPSGIPGELQVRGMNVFAGYWNRRDATAAAFTADGWFRTGDIATMDAEGFVTIVDRAKDIIIRGGENIACIEIEDALATHPGVVEAAVVGRPHETLGEEPVAFVTLAGDVSGEELRRHLSQRLARHKVPVAIIASPEPLPHNAAGKVIKGELRGRARALEEEAQ